MKPVLVLDANQRSALAVTRSLGKHGVQVHTGEAASTALAAHSRFSRHFTEYPSPTRESEHFIQTLVEYVQEQQVSMLLPMTELTTLLLLEQRQAFAGVHIPFPDMQTVDMLADKCTLMRLAGTLNIPVPQTWYADSQAKLPLALEKLPYPLVLKPGKSWQLQQGQWRRAGVRIAATTLEAREILASDPAFQAHPFLLQEHVEGYGAGVFALYDNGKPLTFFAHRRRREKPPEGGVSVLSESVAVDPVPGSYARMLLDEAGWHGIAMVEFRVASDGTPYLMEINTRFWGSLQLAIDAGVEFPWLLYQLASGKRPDPVSVYRTGIRLRWLLGDLDHLYLTLRDNRYTLPDKLKTVLKFLQPTPFRTRHEVNRWNDLAPFFYELKAYLRDLRS
jgi:predicted ATP-grasp superfamily ATP-dependent carboligase